MDLLIVFCFKYDFNKCRYLEDKLFYFGQEKSKFAFTIVIMLQFNLHRVHDLNAK